METKVALVCVFWGGGAELGSKLFCSPRSVHHQRACIHPFLLSPLVQSCGSMISTADMNNGTIASVLLEGAPRQFTLIVLKLPGWESQLFCLML